jgi:diguanylate cyclase (GGDEF)-like protein
MSISRTDKETGLYNKNAVIETLDAELKRGMRYGGDLSFITIILNGLDTIKETSGETAEKTILNQLSTYLNDMKRGSDVLGRYSYDEFILMLNETAVEGAIELAERISRTLQFRLSDGTVQTLSLNIGVTERGDDVWDLNEVLEIIGNVIQESRDSKGEGLVVHRSA